MDLNFSKMSSGGDIAVVLGCNEVYFNPNALKYD